MNNKFTLTALSSAMLSVVFATGAQAQTEDSGSNPKIEEVEVIGFKASLKKALDSKKFRTEVSDSIHAEDVGKSTDQNIADALSRVTGVSVVEDGGEGARISIRGTSPDMNQIQMNGVTLTGGVNSGSDPIGGESASDGSVDLSSFSSDILSSIDVIKTPAADHDEGSLGATVILRTLKPLSLREPRRVLSLEQRYNDYVDDKTLNFNASYADKFFDDTFGFVISVSGNDQATRQDRIRHVYENAAVPIVDSRATSANARFASDLNGDLIRVLHEGETIADLGDSFNPNEQVAVQGTTLDDGTAFFVLAPQLTDFSTSANNRDRFSVNLGFELQPTDATNIQLDLTGTKQEVGTDYHNFRLNYAPLATVSAVDPQEDWNTVDVENSTMVAARSRRSSGFFNRAQGERELETKIANLQLEHAFSDSLFMEVGLGYSKTVDETIRHRSVTTATWGTIGANAIDDIDEAAVNANLEEQKRAAALAADPSLTDEQLQAITLTDDERFEIEPVGYDCSQGSSNCEFFMGTELAEFDAFDGSPTRITSRFNPFDINANHLGALRFRDDRQADTVKTASIDFDWDIDTLGVTTLEFGAKVTSREIDVHTQNTEINNGQTLEAEDRQGQPIGLRGMSSIQVADMLSGEAFPWDDYGVDLIGNRSADFFGGFPMIDVDRAIEAVAGRDAESIGSNENNLGTRNIKTDVFAAYFKANFEAVDGRLTGNVGVRYVEDTRETMGYSGITYYRNPHVFDPYNLLVERRLGDIDNPNLQACPEPIEATNVDLGRGDSRLAAVNEADFNNCWDWALTHAYNSENNATIPYVNGEWVLGSDPNDNSVNRLVNIQFNADGSYTVLQNDSLPAQIIVDDQGNTVASSANNHRHFRRFSETWQYLDRSTSIWGAYAQTEGNDANKSFQRQSIVRDSHVSDLLLPSLNLNFALTEDMIVRFATSKTMTRPQPDLLNPSAVVRESIWDLNGNGNAGNTQLKPLVSTNLDFSYEWYFADTGLLSLALFSKDIKDQPIRETVLYHYRDVRDEYDLQDGDLLLDYSADAMPGDAAGREDCSPQRYVGGAQAANWEIKCHVVAINQAVNSGKSEVKGFEFGYSQNYDFLPSVLSGFGSSFNYTYQESKQGLSTQIPNNRFPDFDMPNVLTPRHSANTTVFYEKGGLMLRLAHRYSSAQLMGLQEQGLAVWQDNYERYDFSSTYELNDNATLTFQVSNLTDEVTRNFVTAFYMPDPSNSEVVLHEGNVQDDSSITRERTESVYKNGTQYRLGIRINF